MNGWPRVALRTLCQVSRATISPEDQGYEELPSVGLEQVESMTGIITLAAGSRTGEGRSVNFRFDNRHILYGKLRPYLNKVALPEFVGRCSTELVPLLPAPGVDRRFLAALLRQPGAVQAVMAANTGSRMPRADMNVLLALPVPRPPIAVQRRIADILDRAASIRRLRRQAQETARQIVPALFNKMFGDPQPEVEGWPTRELGDLLALVESAIRTGPFGSQLLHSEFVSDGVPVLGIDNVVRNHFRWTAQRCIPIEKFERLRRFTVRPRDLLITIMGTTGRCAVAPDDLPPCISTKHLCVLTLNQTVILPEFAWAALLFDPFVRSQIARTGHGAIMEGWNMGLVKRLSVRVPPLSIQSRFARRVASIMGVQEQHAKAANVEEWATASIQSQLFSA